MTGTDARKDFFISYTGADKKWAEWIAWNLEEAGYSVIIQAWDFRPGGNFVLDMDQATRDAERTIAILSPDYFASGFTPSEWAAAFRRDPKGKLGLLLPVRVQHCDVEGLLGQIVYIDLVECDEEIARTKLLAGVQYERAKPIVPPEFPQGVLQIVAPSPTAEQPRFPAAFPDIWNVSYHHKDYFTGCEQVLQQIHEAFRTASTTSPIVAIGGPGGMGKTQTAAEYAYIYRSDYQCVLWIKAESPTTLTSDFTTAAHLLKLSESKGHDQRQVVASVLTWLRTNSQWLLIFDNADDLATVNDFLPKAGRGHILLTTRALALGSITRRFVLERLSTETGALFLLRRATIIGVTASHEATTKEKYAIAQMISERLGGLPLALDQAGAYIEDTACSLSRYLYLYQTRSDEIQRMRFGPVPDYPESVATAWTLSRTLVQASDPVAADLLRFCAFLYPEAISEVILTEGACELGPLLGPVAGDPVKLDLAIGELRKYSLLSRDPDTETLSMHRLLQDVQRAELDQKDQRTWAERAVRAVNKAVQSPLAPSLHRVQDLRVQAQTCMTLIKQWNMQFSEAEQLRQWMEKQTL